MTYISERYYPGTIADTIKIIKDKHYSSTNNHYDSNHCLDYYWERANNCTCIYNKATATRQYLAYRDLADGYVCRD
jgi:hypothetical protein